MFASRGRSPQALTVRLNECDGGITIWVGAETMAARPKLPKSLEGRAARAVAIVTLARPRSAMRSTIRVCSG